MKILVVSHEYPPIGGGGANACMYLTKGYAEKCHEVTLVTVWYEGLKEYEIVDGVEIYRVKSKRTHKEHCSFMEMFSYIMKAMPLASKLQKQRKYDICQVFFGIPSGVIGFWLKVRYRLPYVIRFGGGDIPGFQDRFKLIYKLIGPFVKIIWKNASALVANSQGLREFALEFYDKKPIDVIYNGVDTNKLYPDQEKKANSKINLLFVSRLIERKGLQHVIPELREIKEETNKNIHLTVVGDGPYRSTLETLAKESNVNDMISFEGQKNKEELLPYYQAGDVFVFPSKREGMPNAVLEAMACGLPIVMTPCEGSSELIDKNGVIVNVQEIKKVLIDIVKNDAERAIFSKESRERAVMVFSWDSVVNAYINIFNTILKDR